MEQQESPLPDPAETARAAEPRRSRLRSGVVAGGLAVGLALAGLGVAAAQEAPTPEGTSPSAAGEGRGPKFGSGFGPGDSGRGGFGHGGFRRGGFGHGGFGHGGFGHGRGAIHGEFTVRGPDDGYRTVASQRGKVTKVSQSSIEARSDDGYTRTYEVDESTLVNAGRDGIEDVKVGDQVHIAALVEGKVARAIRILDLTNVERLSEPWRGRHPAPGQVRGS